MPRMSRKRKNELAFFLNDRGRVAYNVLCRNPHAHILLTMRPLDEKGSWLPKSKKEYVLDENGEKIRLPSGRYKTRKVDLVDWNNRENAEVWRRAWAVSASYGRRQWRFTGRADGS